MGWFHRDTILKVRSVALLSYDGLGFSIASTTVELQHIYQNLSTSLI
jgi:hypothetical protein